MKTHLEAAGGSASREKPGGWHSITRGTDYRHQTFRLVQKMCQNLGVREVTRGRRAPLQPHCDASVCEIMHIVGQILQPLDPSHVSNFRRCLVQHPDYACGKPPIGMEGRSDLSLLADLSMVYIASQFPRLVNHMWSWASAALCDYKNDWSAACFVCGQRDRDDALQATHGPRHPASNRSASQWVHAFCVPVCRLAHDGGSSATCGS
jgi:hypothetical protein